MIEPDNLWVCIGHIRHAGGDLRAEFIVDARQFSDDRAAREVTSQAGRELDGRRIPAEFEYIDVRSDEPVPELPTWEEYRNNVLLKNEEPR